MCVCVCVCYYFSFSLKWGNRRSHLNIISLFTDDKVILFKICYVFTAYFVSF